MNVGKRLCSALLFSAAAGAALPATQFQLGYITASAFTAGTSPHSPPSWTTPIKGKAGKKDKA